MFDAEALTYDNAGQTVVVGLDEGHVIEASHVVLATGYVMPDFVRVGFAQGRVELGNRDPAAATRSALAGRSSDLGSVRELQLRAQHGRWSGSSWAGRTMT